MITEIIIRIKAILRYVPLVRYTRHHNVRAKPCPVFSSSSRLRRRSMSEATRGGRAMPRGEMEIRHPHARRRTRVSTKRKRSSKSRSPRRVRVSPLSIYLSSYSLIHTHTHTLTARAYISKSQYHLGGEERRGGARPRPVHRDRRRTRAART